MPRADWHVMPSDAPAPRLAMTAHEAASALRSAALPFVGSCDWPAEEDEEAWERMLDAETEADARYHEAADRGEV